MEELNIRVKVSVDSGQTWHPASGRASWTYSFAPVNAGAITIMSRAVDDSGNIETSSAGLSVTAGTVTTSTIPLARLVPGRSQQRRDGGVDGTRRSPQSR